MKYGLSFRGKRLSRRADRQRQAGQLNIVSLMDIFTILVFFLLVNSAAVEVLPNPRAMTLPESISDIRAQEVPVLMVTREQIILQVGARVREVMTLEAAENAEGNLLPALRSALMEEIGLVAIENDPDQRMTRGEINIMADRDIPYATLKKVMATSTNANFARLSLAVIQRAPTAGGGS
jgi:biopolymer transport protein TolR